MVGLCEIDSTQKYLCRVEGLYDRKQYMSFATVLCLIPVPVKISGNGLAAGCQLFYCKIYGYFLQCINEIVKTFLICLFFINIPFNFYLKLLLSQSKFSGTSSL